MIAYLAADKVSSLSSYLRMHWRSRCHCWVKRDESGTSAEGENNEGMFFASVLGHAPSDELFLTTDVLVVSRVLFNSGNAHNKVHKCLCLLAEKVQEIAEAAVLCDHEHRA